MAEVVGTFAGRAGLEAAAEDRQHGAEPGVGHRPGSRIAAMASKLKRAGRRSGYRLRKQIVEPVFGQIKQARAFRQSCCAASRGTGTNRRSSAPRTISPSSRRQDEIRPRSRGLVCRAAALPSIAAAPYRACGSPLAAARSGSPFGQGVAVVSERQLPWNSSVAARNRSRADRSATLAWIDAVGTR
jgi:hypothetical protein